MLDKLDPISRKSFLKYSLGFLALSAFDKSKATPKYAFSTLGCPKWSLDEIINCAAKNGYHGIEFRGLQGELELSKCKEFKDENIKATKQKLKDNNLVVINLGSSANLHFADSIERKKQIDHGKRFIDLADQLECQFIRVFPNDLPKDQDRNHTIDLIIKGLVELGAYAKPSKVSILLESHGQVVAKDLLHQIMSSTSQPNVGLIWDIWNMWSVTKESPSEVYRKLKDFIKHVHVKDAHLVDNKSNYVQIGKGECPLHESLTALKSSNYDGFLSFEWEKLWHPEIEDPELVIPLYPAIMNQLMK